MAGNGNGNGMAQLPGGQVLSVIMAAPTDILGLATRQMTETLSTFNVGMQRFAAAAATPPALPAGLPTLPAGFPMLPLPGMTQAAPSAPSAPSSQGAIGPQIGASTRRIPDRGIII